MACALPLGWECLVVLILQEVVPLLNLATKAIREPIYQLRPILIDPFIKRRLFQCEHSLRNYTAENYTRFQVSVAYLNRSLNIFLEKS